MRILFVCMSQFGRLVDTYAYCKYMRCRNRVTYICWDYGFPKEHMRNVRLIYVNRSGGKFQRYIRFQKAILKEMRQVEYDICHITNYLGCSLLRLLNHRTKYIYDIRSGAVNLNKCKRAFRDWARRTEGLCFKHRTIVSAALAEKYNMSHAVEVITVGSDVRCIEDKSFDTLRFLYIGILTNRRIEDTIHALVISRKKYPEIIEKYTIIAKGNQVQIDNLKLLLSKLNAAEFIEIIGEIPYRKLGQYLENHNIGVAYVPINEYYNKQPTTKIFDYMLSGLAVISTATTENQRTMTKANGVLVRDSIEGVCEGIDEVISNREEYSSSKIRSSVDDHTWENLTKKLEKYMGKIVFPASNKSC